MRRRIQAGWINWKKASGVLCDRKLSAKVKGKMYKSVVRPAMLYGMETVRWALGVTRKDKIRNEYVRGTAKIAKLEDNIRNARLREKERRRIRGKNDDGDGGAR